VSGDLGSEFEGRGDAKGNGRFGNSIYAICILKVNDR
jgi:hypothetical protein